MGSSVPLENKAAPQEKSPAEARPHQTAKVPAATRSQSKDECVRFDNGNARVQRGHLETRGEWFAMRQFGDGCVRPPSMLRPLRSATNRPNEYRGALAAVFLVKSPMQPIRRSRASGARSEQQVGATQVAAPAVVRCVHAAVENRSSCVVKRHAIVFRRIANRPMRQARRIRTGFLHGIKKRASSFYRHLTEPKQDVRPPENSQAHRGPSFSGCDKWSAMRTLHESRTAI
jgi:hypothetical protein